MSNAMNPVFALELHLESMIVQTGIRVFDVKSLNAVLALCHSKAFGRVSRKRFVFRIHSGHELWDGDSVFPLVHGGLGEIEGRVSHSFALLSQYYASREHLTMRGRHDENHDDARTGRSLMR